jgi:hypothetical protein
MSIKIISAYFGSDVNQLVDVTETVQHFVNERQGSQEITLKVNAKTLALKKTHSTGEAKQLNIYYRYTEDNVIRVKNALENDEITFHSSKYTHIQDHFASNQTEKQSQDITQMLNKYISDAEEFSKKTIENSFKSSFFFEHDHDTQNK